MEMLVAQPLSSGWVFFDKESGSTSDSRNHPEIRLSDNTGSSRVSVFV